MAIEIDVFETLEEVNYPLLIVENVQAKWQCVYANTALKELASVEESEPLPEELQPVLEDLQKQTSSKRTSLHNFKIFDTVYTIYASHQDKKLFIIFVELEIEELVKNTSFMDMESEYNPLVVVLDYKGLIADANEAFLDMVQEKREEVLQKNFFESFIPSDPQKLNQYLHNIYSNESHHQHFITPLKGKKTGQFHIQWQVSMMKKGEQIYIIAIGSNISKYIEENSELKRENTSIKVGFDFFPMAIGYMDSKGNLITMNPKFLKLLKIPETKKLLNFKEIPFFKRHINFQQMSEYIALIKEMNYSFREGGKEYRVDIRMLHNTKKNTKLYILVVQKF